MTLSGDGFGIVEQNFDFDLLSPTALMQKAVGQTVTLLRTNPATGAETRERATVLAVNGGVVLKIGDRIEVLRDDGLPVRVIFDSIPPNLRARPTLSVTLEARAGRAAAADLSYLTTGLGWKADYVALFDERPARIDVQGWITLTNSTGTTFNNADTLLVAGDTAPVQRPATAAGTDGRRRATQPAPRAPTASGSATSTSIRSPAGPRSPTPRPSRSASSTSAAPPPRKAYEYRNSWLGTAEPAAKRLHHPQILERPRRRARRRAARPARCASTCATPAARRSSSARARSATRRWAPRSG